VSHVKGICSTGLTLDLTEDIADFAHLIALKRQRLFAIEFRLVALEYRPEGEQFGVYAPYGP
jgi:hypothetical protein